MTGLIDARMRKYARPAGLRALATQTIGIGPGFTPGMNVDLAIETLPGSEGTLVASASTAIPTGKAMPLGGAGEERFVHAAAGGAWRPFVEIGARVETARPIGVLGNRTVKAPLTGCLRGLVRAAPGGSLAAPSSPKSTPVPTRPGAEFRRARHGLRRAS